MAAAGRRDEIVQVSFELLAVHRVDQLTTRRVAKAVGISQPGLFRHFRSREEILLAVVERARVELGVALKQVVETRERPLEVIHGLLEALLGQVERRPGLPRLLFHDVASGSQNALRASLSHLVSAQEGFVVEMVREGIRAGDLAPSVDAEHAGEMFLGVLQGFVLHWLRGERKEGLEESANRLFGFWLAGVQEAQVAVEVTPSAGMRTEKIISLDVRPLIQEGVDPLGRILQDLDRVDPRGLLVVRAPFRPSPLLALLSKRGHGVEARDLGDGDWEVWVWGLNAPPILSLSDLPAPEPMERLVGCVEQLVVGSCLLAHTPRLPRLLLRTLDKSCLDCAALEAADGTGLVWVGRSA